MSYRDIYWKRLSDEVDARGGSGSDFVLAMKDHYAIYEKGLYLWAAGLYDKDVGGFYYSNSGRDNEPFRPDVESTLQAINIIVNSRMVRSAMDLPERMRAQIERFVCSLLDPEDGYVYHPQWKKEDTNHLRRGRDLSWAIGLSKMLNFKLPYKTATERLREMKSAPKDEPVTVAEHLRSKEAFIAYLDSCDWNQNAYWSGSNLVAQDNQVIAAGLEGVAVEYLNEKQNKETGIWGDKLGYVGINGLLKISSFYASAKLPFPNATKAVRTAMDCLTTDEKCNTVCYQYNAWFSLENLISNIKKFGDGNITSEMREIDKILIENAQRTIRATTEKTLTFKKTDASFSYLPHASTGFSQKMPVSIHETNEGDLNASVLASTGITGRVYNALGLSDFFVPMFGEDDFKEFIAALKY